MADQPQNPQSPNSGRISAMLQDLAAQKDGAQGTAPTVPARAPAPIAVGGPPPMNLPIGQAPTVPARAPAPAVPVLQQPAVAAPKPPPLVPPTPPPVTVTVTVPAAAPQSVAPPVAPIAPRPVAPPAVQPAGAIPPPRPAPPPAPREVAATQPPKPAPPPPPPPPAAAIQASGPEYASQLRTMSSDMGQVQVGQAPAAVRPAPAPATPAAPPQITIAPTIIIPAAPAGGSKKPILFAGLGVVVLALVALTVWSFFGGSGDVIVETPTPSAAPTLTTTPQGRDLSSYFGLPKATATITGTDTAVSDFRNALLIAEPAAKQGLTMAVLRADSPMAPGAFLAATLGAVPVDVTGSLGTDWVALAYGQTEAFDGSGQPLIDAPIQPTVALVLEVADASKANQAMQAWEGTGLDGAAADLFGYILENAVMEGFSSGTYRNVPIRYRNFPYADHSLDWALALGSNGKNYLILTGSRESAFFVVDQLMQ